MYVIIQGLADFCAMRPIDGPLLLLAFWLIWPGLMFIVGFIGESRLVPVGRHQSKAFMPGDLMLGIMVLALISLYAYKPEAPDWWGFLGAWWIAIAVVMALLALLARAHDVTSYPTRAGNSPTKILHDVIGYFLIPMILVGMGIPKLVAGIMRGGEFYLPGWAVFLSALAFYMLCVFVDIKKGVTPEDIRMRHTEDWQPIWQKSR